MCSIHLQTLALTHGLAAEHSYIRIIMIVHDEEIKADEENPNPVADNNKS